MGKHAVTGAFGFSGKCIAKRLLDQGKDVVGITNSPHRESPLTGKLPVIPYRFDDVDAFAESLKGVNVLIITIGFALITPPSAMNRRSKMQACFLKPPAGRAWDALFMRPSQAPV